MSKGRAWPREDRRFRDPETGRMMRQITSHPSIHHHPSSSFRHGTTQCGG